MDELTVREVEYGDLLHLLHLYTQLHDNTVPSMDGKLESLWRGIIADANHHILVGLVNAEIVASCVLLVIPNLTHNQRPYALVENVVTHPEHRKKGYASRLLNYARGLAKDNSCYKIMLMTSSKQESTWRFYERAGYNRIDKTAFIKWLW